VGDLLFGIGFKIWKHKRQEKRDVFMRLNFLLGTEILERIKERLRLAMDGGVETRIFNKFRANVNGLYYHIGDPTCEALGRS
jgi:hypothetical protein